MSTYHCWSFLRRILCAALAVAGFAVAYMSVSALAVESIQIPAAKTVLASAGSGPGSLTPLVPSSEDAKPLALTKSILAADVARFESEEHVSSEPIAVVNSDEVKPPLLSPKPLNTKTVDFLSIRDVISETGTVKTIAGEIDFVSDEELELIFQVVRGRRTLSKISVGIQKGFTYYVPMLEIARLTQLSAEPDFDKQVVEGFFAKETNPYRVDVKNGTFTINGETQNLPEDSVIVKDLGQGLGEFYIALDTMNQIWPLDLKLNFSDLSLSINTTKLLPEDLKKRREILWASFKNNEEDIFASDNLIYVPNNYKTLTPPVLNVSNRVRWRSKTDSLVNSVNVASQNDLLGTTADFSIGAVSDGDETLDITNARLRLTRRDYGDGSLPLDLKLFQAGDVSARPSDLIEGSIPGRGVVLSNRPIRKPQTFDEITVEGTAQPGWEIELYNGNKLLDFGTIDDTGEYRFDNVALNYGTNNLRILLYGPQGQIEERLERYQIGSKMLLPGETTFEFAAVDTYEDIFTVNDNNAFRPKGLTYQARVDQGINRFVSLFSTYTETPTDEKGDQRYVTVGANIPAFGGLGQVEAYKNIGGGEAFDLRYLSNFSGTRLKLRSSIFKDFESEDVGFESNAKTFEHEVGLDKNVKSKALGNIGLSFDYQKTKYADDTRTSDIRTGIYSSRDGIRVTNKTNTRLNDGSHQNTQGDISVNARLSSEWQMRGRLDYEVFPERKLDIADLELRYRNRNKFTAAVDVTQDLQDDTTRVGANASYDFGEFLGGVDMGWSAAQGFNVGVRASTSLGPYGEEGRYIASSQKLSGTHKIRGRVYEDLNANNIFDEGDNLLEKAIIRANAQRSKPSNEDGIASIERAGPPGPAIVRIDEDELPDPFLASALDGYSTILRPNTRFPTLDFPVILTGTIDGTVYFENGTPVPGLIIELHDDQGHIIQETTTQFDGFYTFEYVKPGSYTVVVSASHKVSVPSQPVRVSSDDLFAYGVDLHFVAQASKDEMVAANADGVSGRIALYHAPATGGTEKPAPHLSDGGFQTTVRAVRIGEHPYKVRLVLDLSGQSGYSISSLNDGDSIIIDLPRTAWDAKREIDMRKHPLFKDVHVKALTDETGAVIGTRLHIVPRDIPIEIFYNNALPPENGHGHRIYVDFLRKK